MKVKGIATKDPVFDSIQNEILDRVSWSKKKNVHSRFASLAQNCLQHGDFVYSVICAYEALRRKYIFDYEIANGVHFDELPLRGQSVSQELIDEQFKEYGGFYGKADSRQTILFVEFKRLRNIFALGENSFMAMEQNTELQKAFRSSDSMRAYIGSCFEVLGIAGMASEM